MAVERQVCKTTSKEHIIMKSNQSELSTLRNSVRRGASRLVVLAALGLAGLLATPQARASSTLTSVSVGEQLIGVVNPGGTASFPVTVTRTGAGRLDVELSISGLPAGATATFLPAQVTFTGNKPDSQTAIVTITTPASFARGRSCFSVIATELDHNDHHPIKTATAANAMYVGVGHVCLTKMPDSTFRVGCAGAPGELLLLQSSPSIIAPVWTTIATNTTDASGWFTWQAPDTTNSQCRFYRTVKP
ncbi:MAG: hypothetical protein JWR69_1445 [Pedosphaera sp.]|nr:hypothetical protein [Pedosphaera sp.]